MKRFIPNLLVRRTPRVQSSIAGRLFEFLARAKRLLGTPEAQFLGVGFAVMLTGAVVLVLLVKVLNLDPDLAKMVELVFSIQLNFALSCVGPWRGPKKHSLWRRLRRFNLSRAATAGLGYLIFWVLSNPMHIHYLIASAISVMATTSINWMVTKHYVFPALGETA